MHAIPGYVLPLSSPRHRQALAAAAAAFQAVHPPPASTNSGGAPDRSTQFVPGSSHRSTPTLAAAAAPVCLLSVLPLPLPLARARPPPPPAPFVATGPLERPSVSAATAPDQRPCPHASSRPGQVAIHSHAAAGKKPPRLIDAPAPAARRARAPPPSLSHHRMHASEQRQAKACNRSASMIGSETGGLSPTATSEQGSPR